MNRTLIAISLTTLFFNVLSAPCPGQSGTSNGELLSEVERLDVRVSSLTEFVERQEQLQAETRQIRLGIVNSATSIHSLHRKLSTRQTVIDELRKWATADLVLGNRLTPNAAALAKSPSGYQVVAVAVHPFQQFAIAAATQGGVPFRADAASGAVLEELNREIKYGAVLPMRVPDTINSRLNELAELSPRPISGIQYMVFQDPVSGQQKVAAVQSASAEHPVHTLDRGIEALAQAAFTGGSVWIGDQEEIEKHLEIGTPFIEYCALGILDTLRQKEFQRDHVALSISVDLDTSLIGETPEFQHRLMAGYMGDKDRTGGILALGRHLQDEFYERLNRQGLRVVERENESKVKSEDLRTSLGSSNSHISKASHALFIDVDKSENGTDRVSVRLVDVTSDDVIWTANDTRTIAPNRNWRNYILHTGVPSIAEFRSEALRDRVLKHFETEGNFTSRPPRKLILINEGGDDGFFNVRSLYGSQTIPVAKDDVTLTAISTTAGERIKSDSENAFGKQILHYVARRLSIHLAPPAVRLSAAQDHNGRYSWTLPLGSENHMLPGSRFRLLFQPVGAESLSIFPSVACVADVLDTRTSRMIAPGNATKAFPPFQDAVAICDSWEHFNVAVMIPVVPTKLKINTKKFHDNKSRGYTFGGEFRTAIVQSLSKRVDCSPCNWELQNVKTQYWDEIIDRQKTLRELQKRGVTHVMCGELELVSDTRTEVHYGLERIETALNGDAVEGTVIDSVRFVLSNSDL